MPPKARRATGSPDVSQALAEMDKARARGRGRRSPLYLWFRENHDKLAVAFERNAPAWSGLAAYLGEHGVRDGDGKPPNARGTRDAWYRVRRDVVAARTKRHGSPTPIRAPTEVAPGIRGVAAEASSGAALAQVSRGDRPRPQIDLRPGAPKSAPVVSGQPSPQPAQAGQPARAPEQVDEQLRAVLDGLGGRRKAGTRMPQQVE